LTDDEPVMLGKLRWWSNVPLHSYTVDSGPASESHLNNTTIN